MSDADKRLKQQLPWKQLLTAAAKKPGLLFGLGLAGMALILFADLFDTAPSISTTPENAGAAAETAELSEYTDQLAARLEELLSGVEGAGETRVMITLESSEETVYALDEKRGEQQGYEWSHVILDEGNGDSALVETTWLPEIRGVAVVCQGGGDTGVQARLTEMVSVLLGVSTNRISIAKMS